MKTIRGQERAVNLLLAQLEADRLHHAYIFHGPVGVGKFTTAMAFARLLLGCEGEIHADLHVVTKELARYSKDADARGRKLMNIPVVVLREALIEPVYRAATVAGGRKMFIVDEAELLDTTGQNLLLKTLEEPPAGTVIILVTSSEDRLLATIRSRCQRVAFSVLDDEVVSRWLDESTPGMSAEVRATVLTFAQGSIGRASMAVEYNLIAWIKRVLPAIDDLERGRPDGRLGGDMARMIDDFAKAWVEAHGNDTSKEAANRLGSTLMGSMIGSHAAARLREIAGRCEAGNTQANAPMMQPWIDVIDAVGDTQRLFTSHVNPGLVCDHLVAQMSGILEPVQ